MNMWTKVGRRGPLNTQRRPSVTIREMAFWYPGSVYASLLSSANWLSKLHISRQAKELSHLSGPKFLTAVERLLT